MTFLERLMEALPFLILLGLILFFMMLGKWCLDQYCEITAREIERLDKRFQEIEQRLVGIDKTLSDYREWRGVVVGLTKDFDKLHEAVSCRNPIETIVEEQRGIDR